MQLVEFGAEGLIEFAEAGKAVEFFALEIEIEFHMAPVMGKVRGKAVFRVIRREGAEAHVIEEKGLIGGIAGKPEGAVLLEDEFTHAKGGGDEVLVDQFRCVVFLELVEPAQDAGAFFEEDKQDFLDGEEEDFRVGAFGQAHVVDLAVDFPDPLTTENPAPVSRGIEEAHEVRHHPAGAPFGHGLAIEVEGVGEIGGGKIEVQGFQT